GEVEAGGGGGGRGGGDVPARLQAGDEDADGLARDVDHVVALRSADRDRVGRAIRCTEGSREIDVDLRQLGADEIVHDDGVRAAGRAVVDRLDAAEVGRDVAHVLEEAH